MKKLIIVESPSKAETIQKYLKDQGYRVIASKGHIRDLPVKELGIDIDDDFKIHDVTMEGKDKVIKMIKAEAEDADEIFLASDPDREGEKISQSISEILPKGKKKNMHRIMFNSVTKESILKAIAKPGKIHEKKCDAQKVRRILDRLVGYKISSILYNKMGPGYSAGRVQSVALRIIVEREDLIKAFIPKTWFTIFVDFNKDQIDFRSEYFGQQILKKEILEKEEDANKILSAIENKPFIINSINTEDKEKKPTAPFTTSKLQQEGSQKLKFDTKLTMQIAQKLYEGVSIKQKNGAFGLITYMRTDSVRVEPQAITDVRAYIEQAYGKDYLPTTAVEYKEKKAGNVQDAHEAIRPTDLSLDPDSIRHDLTDEQYQLYKLIYNKFVSSQMANAQLEKTTVMLDCDGNFFKTTGTVVKFDGFTKAFKDLEDEKKKKKGEDSEEDSAVLPKLVKDESLTPKKAPEVSKQVESPPPRFTEATLVKELEDKGVGRPSTYSSIISNITSREYVTKDKQRFLPSEKGTSLCRILVTSFPREMDIKFTANVEDTLDLIEDGKVPWLKFMNEFWPDFRDQLEKAKRDIVQVAPVKVFDNSKFKTGIHCLVCSTGEYMIRKGKNGDFLACSNYSAGSSDSCKSTQNFKKNKRGEIQLVTKDDTPQSDKKCPVCGRPMTLRKGQNGDFYGCSGYNDDPKCLCTVPATTTHILCPTCKKGEIVEKKSKAGKVYWACSNYKSCNQVYWEEKDFKGKPENNPTEKKSESSDNEN